VVLDAFDQQVSYIGRARAGEAAGEQRGEQGGRAG